MAVPDADGVYQVGHGVTPPHLVQSIDPMYTDLARKKKITGVSVVELVVDIDGIPQHVRVVKSISDGVSNKLKKAAMGLDQSAISTVSQYRFQPAEYQGKPVPTRIKVEMEFRIY